MKNKLKILTDGWWEILIYQLKDFLDFDIQRLNKWILKKKSFDGGDFKNALIMRKFENNNDFQIIHYNNWLDPLLCSVPKNKVTIFQSHGIHIGLWFRNSMRALEKPYKIFIWAPLHILYQLFLRYKIHKFDVYLTSIPSALPYAQRFRKNAIWLPNAIDFNFFNKDIWCLDLDHNYINIFLPSAIRILKNQRKAWEIIDVISQKYPNRIKVYIIEHPGSNEQLVKDYLKKFDKHIIWLPLIDRERISIYYKSPWDLVLWNMCQHPTNAMLNMIELEAMACKAPIVAMDVFEVIKVSYDKIEELALKVLEDTWYRKEYVKRNYSYVKSKHSIENVSKRYAWILLEYTLKKGLNLNTGMNICKITKPIIIKHIHEILKIESEYFTCIGTWDLKNFTCEYYNKFDCSYLLFKWDRVIGYIIGYSDKNYWYVNRIAISENHLGGWLWNYLLTCFQDNLKYNFSTNIIELVTHDSLKIDSFYLKEGYEKYTTESSIKDFLNRKWKESSLEEFFWENRTMGIFYKNI